MRNGARCFDVPAAWNSANVSVASSPADVKMT
jgi:hypothetical protein